MSHQQKKRGHYIGLQYTPIIVIFSTFGVLLQISLILKVARHNHIYCRKMSDNFVPLHFGDEVSTDYWLIQTEHFIQFVMIVYFPLLSTIMSSVMISLFRAASQETQSEYSTGSSIIYWNNCSHILPGGQEATSHSMTDCDILDLKDNQQCIALWFSDYHNKPPEDAGRMTGTVCIVHWVIQYSAKLWVTLLACFKLSQEWIQPVLIFSKMMLTNYGRY